MKKISLILSLSIFLSFVFVFPSYCFSEYKDSASFEKVYEEAYKLGKEEGYKVGQEDAKNKEKNDYIRRMPSYSAILEKFIKYDLETQELEKIVNVYIKGYEEGYKEGYICVEKESEKEKEEKEKKVNYAESFGKYLGEIYGKTDYYNGKKNNWEKAIPSDRYIIDMFNLKLESREYRDAFIETFRNSFKEAYEENYRKAGYEPIKTTYDQGKKDGDNFGKLLGEIYGQRDFYQGLNSNWEKAIPSNNIIVEVFNLNIETEQYRDLFLTSFQDSFQIAYNKYFSEANLGPQKISYEQGIIDGENFGDMFGNLNGRKDYSESKNSNWKRNFPSDIEICREFALNNDSEKYIEGFLIGFKRVYEKAYNEGFRSGNIDLNKLKSETAYSDGKEIGITNGEQAANSDNFLKENNNLSKHFKSDLQLIFEFNLYLDNDRYCEAFISGYRDGFSEGYIKTYQKLNKEKSETTKETKVIPTNGGEVELQDKKIKMIIPSGTYYNDVLVQISNKDNFDLLSNINFENKKVNEFYIENNLLYKELLEKNLVSSKDFIRVSETYSINIINKIKEYNKENLIELSFEYHGPDNGGIYKFVNGEWLYMPSIIEEGVIKTFVVPGSIKEEGSDYAVFIDKSAHKIHDIRGHWAKDEINTYLRRKHISAYKDNTFKPNSYMTKGQLLMVLNKVYKWDLPEDVSSVKKYKDYNQFKNYQKVVQYSLNNGYIKADNKNKLNLDSPITYKEVEALMRKVTKSNNFKWSNTSNKILYKKGVRCKSFNSYNNKITRSEAIYMLYLLNEWKN